MIIKRIIARNYRTLENVQIDLSGYYTAISGKNNAGKSNIIRALRTVLSPFHRLRLRGTSIFGNSGMDWKDEVTSWKKDSKEEIFVCIELEIHKDCDSSIYKFFTEFILKDTSDFTISEVEILKVEYARTHKNETTYSIHLGEKEIFDDFQKKEVLKRLRNSECLIFHNSTNYDFNPFEDNMDRITNFIRAL